VPSEYIDYLLCKKFHWTISQLDEQPSDRVMQFLTIMKIEGSFENIERQKLEAEMESKMKAGSRHG
jgi:hypothetical protein